MIIILCFIWMTNNTNADCCDSNDQSQNCACASPRELNWARHESPCVQGSVCSDITNLPSWWTTSCNLRMKFMSNGRKIKEFNRDDITKTQGFGRLRLKNVHQIFVNGNCCVKIFRSSRYRSNSQTLQVGFDDSPNFSTIRSLQFGICNIL